MLDLEGYFGKHDYPIISLTGKFTVACKQCQYKDEKNEICVEYNRGFSSLYAKCEYFSLKIVKNYFC